MEYKPLRNFLASSAKKPVCLQAGLATFPVKNQNRKTAQRKLRLLNACCNQIKENLPAYRSTPAVGEISTILMVF